MNARVSADGRLAALACVAVMLLSALLLLPRLGDPAGAVWDESYYLGAASRYELGRSQFASHPPLGLMLIAGGDALWTDRDRRDLESLAATKSVRGESIPAGFDFTGIRVGSAVAGVLAAGLFFLLMLQLSGAALPAAMLAGLFVFDTALLAQTRAAQLDGFQLLFALAALNCAVAGLRRPHWGWALGFGLAVGAATMVRANAVLLAMAGPFLLWTAWRAGMRPALATALAGTAGFAAMVAGVFALHLAVAPLPPDPNVPAGVADARWVSPRLQDYFDGAPLTPAKVWAGAYDYIRYMDSDLKGMPLTDANGSRPATWPFGWKPIQYRADRWGADQAVVALVPNYPAWWLSLAGAIGAFGLLLARRGSPTVAMLAALWLSLMAVHWWLAGQRVLYLYNYFLPLVIGWACLAVLARERRLFARTWLVRVAGGAVLAGFLIAAPLALHHRLGPEYPSRWLAARLGVG